MNVPGSILVKIRGRGRGAQILGAVATAALLSGCVGDIASTKVDPRSPIAAEVAKTAKIDSDFPSFREIPAKPTDLPPPRIYGQRAQALEAARNDLEQATAPSTWTLNNTTGFASRARTDAGPDIAPAPNTDTEGFAAAARKRATPPPPR